MVNFFLLKKTKTVLGRKKNLLHGSLLKPTQILLDGLADTWPAKTKWTIDQLMLNYGDTPFKISQSSSRKITMKFKDYVSYMKVQHDEDPLYIFDDKVLLFASYDTCISLYFIIICYIQT